MKRAYDQKFVLAWEVEKRGHKYYYSLFDLKGSSVARANVKKKKIKKKQKCTHAFNAKQMHDSLRETRRTLCR